MIKTYIFTEKNMALFMILIFLLGSAWGFAAGMYAQHEYNQDFIQKNAEAGVLLGVRGEYYEVSKVEKQEIDINKLNESLNNEMIK